MVNNERCVQCGGERVKGATLCIDCLVALINEQGELVRENKVLRDSLSLTRQLLSKACDNYNKLQYIIKTYKMEDKK